MPQTKSAKKELKKTIKRTAKNKVAKNNLDYLFHNFKKALAAKDKKKIQELNKKITKALDKAAKKNIIHANKAARKKSRLMKKVNMIK